MTKKLRTAFGALLLAAALAGTAGAAELKPWKHGVIEPKGDAGFMLMVGTRGFAEKHGLKLEILPMKNGSVAHKALLSGAVDSVESSPGASILAGAHGADIKIIGCDWPGVPHGLIVRPGIDKVAFTGSTEVGKMIARSTAGTGKKVTLELGGTPPEHGVPVRIGPLRQLGEEPGLADPGLPGHPDGCRLAVGEPGEETIERHQFLGAPDEMVGDCHSLRGAGTIIERRGESGKRSALAVSALHRARKLDT